MSMQSESLMPTEVEPRLINRALADAVGETRVAARARTLGMLLSLAIILLLVFPSPASILGLIGALALALTRWKVRGSPLPSTPVNFVILLLFAPLTLGLAVTSDVPAGLPTIYHAVAGAVLFFAISDYATATKDLWRVTAGLVGFAVLSAFAAPFLVQMSDKVLDLSTLYTHFAPVLPKPSNANSVSGAFEAALPLALALIASRQAHWRALGAFAVAPLLLMLLLLQSRGALIAAAVGTAVYLALHRRWTLPLVPLVLLGSLWLNQSFGNPVVFKAPYEMTSEPLTLESRQTIWSLAVARLRESPFTGIGPGAFIVNTDLATGNPSPLARPLHAHNLFLQVGLDAGILGMAALLGLLGHAAAAAWSAYREGDNAMNRRDARVLAIGVLAMLAVIVSHGMFDTIFWGFKPGLFLWGGLGIALGLSRIENQSILQGRGPG